MKQYKTLFIDRDGTLITEPADKQVDAITKLEFMPGVFAALTQLRQAGYRLIMISNQDGLGSSSFPQADFNRPHDLMLSIFASQGIKFDAIHICPHLADDGCDCRKPKLGLVMDYLRDQSIDLANSYVIGDRESDVELAQAMGVSSFRIGSEQALGWDDIVHFILQQPRTATQVRTTNETNIRIELDLDREGQCQVDTGIGFFDHMLEQLVKHAGISARIEVKGDLEIDEHHTVEDTALALGVALKQALGDKRGIGRYGFLLPMDEAQTQVALDLSGRSYFQFDGQFQRDAVGELSTEMVQHFFRSLADGLQATLHIKISGDNTHHMVESMFKAVGRCLRTAIAKQSDSIPSTKGVL